MNIEDAITEAIIGIFSSRQLSKLLILKGGSAIRLLDGYTKRLSIDADFSIESVLTDPSSVFKEMERSLAARFLNLDYELIDFKPKRKPKVTKTGFPDWWGGWACEFKLVHQQHHNKTAETKRRNALIPKGASSPAITIDLSEHEYCGSQRTKAIQGTTIRAYSREMLVIEKLRAICQQHPDYKYRQLTKNRARDFYDIYILTSECAATTIFPH